MYRQQQAILVSTILLILIVFGVTSCIFVGRVFASNNNSKIDVKVNDCSNFENKNFSLINIGRAVNVKNGKIAPGSKGEFDIVIYTTGSNKEVKYKININEKGIKPDNLVFCVKKNGYVEEREYKTLKELAEKELYGNICNSLEVITIAWCWKYETGEKLEIITVEDEKDTLAGSGLKSGKENVFDYSFSIKIGT